MAEIPTLSIERIEFFMRNQTMRLPFRYGNACLTSSPIMHVRLHARDSRGREAVGVSADILPPKWFDKSPEKDYRRNIADLLHAAQLGAYWFQHYASTEQSVFDLWRHAYAQIIHKADVDGLNGLTGSFGVSIIERAVIDAACRLDEMPYHAMLRENRFGIDAGTIHSRLDQVRPADVLPEAPLDHVAIRHTVGLGDPILDEDVDAAHRIDDGLPVSLESWIREAHFRYFKLKLTSDVERDSARLARIAGLLERAAPENYRVSLDGNEQFKDGAALAAWFEALYAQPRVRALLDRAMFIEQPIERSAALDPAAGATIHALTHLPPVVIDESDDALDAFARSADLGYRGTSVKNCKGVFKGLLNAMLVRQCTRDSGVEFLLTGEDLANQPMVPLQQDLCAVSTLGIPHVERNGHHYGGTLGHLAPDERAEALSTHDDLYMSHGRTGRWRIHEGALRVTSLHRRPGFGVHAMPAFGALIPLTDWDYAMLGFDD